MAVLAFILGGVVYEVVLVKLWGQTLGKLLMGICVPGTDNTHLRWRSSFIRWLVAGALPFAFGNLGFSWASWISAGWFVLIVLSVVMGNGRGLHLRETALRRAGALVAIAGLGVVILV